MVHSDDLAPLIGFAGRFGGERGSGGGDLGFHSGLVTEWDELSGANTVLVNGVTYVSNIPVVNSSNTVMLSEGDNVSIIRFKSTYFILGRIDPPGGGAGGRIDGDQVEASEQTTSPTYVDLATPGPSVTTYIGSSRKALAIVTASCSVFQNSAFAAVAVSGASNIAAGGRDSAWLGIAVSGTQNIGGSMSSSILLDAARGLNQGLNTFTMKYASGSGDPTVPVTFYNRSLIVIPY